MALIKRQKKKHKTHWGNGCMILTGRLLCSQLDSCKRQLSPQSQMFIITIIIFIPITQQPVHDRLAENQPTAGLSSLNEYENGMGKSKTELKVHKLENNAENQKCFLCLVSTIFDFELICSKRFEPYAVSFVLQQSPAILLVFISAKLGQWKRMCYYILPNIQKQS